MDLHRTLSLPTEVKSKDNERCNLENAAHLIGRSTAQIFRPALEKALKFYDKEVGLSKVLDPECEWKSLPGIRIKAVDNVENWAITDTWLLLDPNPGGIAQFGPAFELQCFNADMTVQSALKCSLLPLIAGWPSVTSGHTVYAHSIANDGSIGDIGYGLKDGSSYIGITKRSWDVRFLEHQAAALSGSPYRFHTALREKSGAICHQVISWGETFNDAMVLEEMFVDAFSLYPKGLNMIPGGAAGIRWLASRGFECSHKKWEHRHKVVEQFAVHCKRTGRPNPLSALRWREDDYAASVICSNPRNFKKSQVETIRLLESYGRNLKSIAEHMQCAEERIRRLLHGKTYSRVH
jgi:hypothetical protein